MTIFTDSDVYDLERFPATSRRKWHFKNDEKGVSEMCDIMREVKEEGIAEGIERGIVEGIERGIERGIEQTIVQMYKRGKLNLAEACEELNCTPEEFEQYLKSYKKK